MSNNTVLPRLTQLAASIAVAVGGLAFVPAANAAAPAAGTNISNIATASYNDATNTPRTVTSNEVKTTVVQVASFNLMASQTTTANPNGQVSLSHTLTNTGNGADTFQISLANVQTGTGSNEDNYDFTNISVYLDADKNGVPDNNVNLNVPGSTISVAAGQSVGLIVVGTTANTATNGQFGELNLTATNVFTATAAGGTNAATTDSNKDRVNIVAGAVIQVTKSVNVTSVSASGSTADRTVEYTLTYKNTGNGAATNVTLKDVLPANVIYVGGSGVWSGAATNRTDAPSDEVGAAYDFTNNTVNFVLGTVAANTTGTLKFKVTVNSAAPAGPIDNTASFDPDGTGGTNPQNTNTAVVTVKSSYVGTINDSKVDAFADTVTPAGAVDANSDKNDTITKAAQQGVAVLFGQGAITAANEGIFIHNTGNVAETYNISVNKNDLPLGSIVELLKLNGTPLTDTNGDPIVDSGPINAADVSQIVARVTLPSTYSTTTAKTVILTIKPVSDATAPADTINLVISSVTAAKVDLSNGTGNLNGIKDTGETTGEGPYVATDIIDTKATNPGTSVTFPLAVTNFGNAGDNFNISSNAPAGWDVKYFTSDAAGNCSTNQVTNTGNVAVNATTYLCATVTPPVNAPASTPTDIVFTVTSAGSGLSDSITDRVAVNQVRNLVFTPDRTGQIAPGGTVLYTHILTNNGNVDEGVGTNLLPFLVTHVGSLGATTSVYVDLNNNGLAESNELVTGSDLTALLAGTPGGAGLQPGESATILVKVEAPSNATAGQSDTSTVTITPTGSTTGVKVDDTTTVNVGQVRLNKGQAADVNCDGVADGGTYTQNTIQAKPGTCIVYQITATNDGNASVSNVVISDAVPTYTTIAPSPAAPAPALSGVTPAGTVTVTGSNLASSAFPLAPLASATVNFTVKIDQ